MWSQSLRTARFSDDAQTAKHAYDAKAKSPDVFAMNDSPMYPAPKLKQLSTPLTPAATYSFINILNR
jgi:hypothetical protein